MAQEHEIRAWVNSAAWEDQEQAERVIAAIIESGSDDEADWVRITQEDDGISADAGAEDVLAAAARDFDRATERLDEARERLHEAARSAMAAGMSAYRVAQITGMSQVHAGRLRRASA